MSKMERFTNRAKRSLSIATKEAERFRHGYVGTGASGPSLEILQRMVLNSRRGMATSAIWNVTYRAWVGLVHESPCLGI